ncbi:MAG: hypothetical protein P1U86_07235 [Verrucomicrobiales bacterium]|nr:hypothetical protein [Verrucomicrobiales bacterium]
MSASFQPVSSTLGQLLSESPDTGGKPQLGFFIEIEFAEVELDDELVKPFFRASNIIVPVDSWKALAGSKYEFPWMPKPGSIDAGVLAFGMRNPADVIALEFGEVKEGKLTVSFETEIDFEIEADRDELGQVKVALTDLPLELAPLKIGTSIVKQCEDDPDQLANVVSGIINTSDYGAITKVPGGFEMGVSS